MKAPNLTYMRNQLATLLPDTAIIQSLARASDGAGGWTETWAAVTGGTVSARLDPITSRSDAVQTAQAREGLRVDFQLTTEWDAPIAVNRRVVINSDTYEIVQMTDDHSWRVSRRALVARLD